MAPADLNGDRGGLSVVARSISSTPHTELFTTVHDVALVLAECRKEFSAAQESPTRPSNSHDSFLVNKVKTQVYSLLQDKSLQARYAAVILVKPLIEIGGRDFIRGAIPWVRGLNSILTKNDPISTKKLCILLVARIFLLTHVDANLVREITTPALPSFLTSCLQLLKKSSVKAQKEGNDILPSILQCFLVLIPLHPASFRPFLSQIRAVILPVIAPTSSDFLPRSKLQMPTDVVRHSARRMFVLLSVSAPKNGMAEERARSLKDVIGLAHDTADKVFQSVHEDSSSLRRAQADETATGPRTNALDQRPDTLALSAWKRVEAGIERLEGLLQTVSSFFDTPSNASFSLPLGEVMILLQRVLFVLPPSRRQVMRINQSIAPEERESMFARLPRLHVVAMQTCCSLFARIAHDGSATVSHFLSAVFGVLLSERAVSNVRQTSYILIARILRLSGLSLTTEVSRDLSACIRLCCQELLPTAAFMQSQSKIQLATQGARSDTDSLASSMINSFDTTNLSRVTCANETIQESATRVLEYALTRTPTNVLTPSTLQRIHETAVLSKRRSLMLASVSCMQMSTSVGILPHLSRTFPDDMEVERFRRPQMPLIKAENTFQQSEALNGNSPSDETGDQWPSKLVQSQDIYATGFRVQSTQDWQSKEEKGSQSGNHAVQEPQNSHFSKRQKLTHNLEDRDAVIEDLPSDSHGEAADRSSELEPNLKASDIIVGPADSAGDDSGYADAQGSGFSDERIKTSMPLEEASFPKKAIDAASSSNDRFKDSPHDDSESSEFEVPILEMDSESDEVSEEAPG